jgi:hypothetical protein
MPFQQLHEVAMSKLHRIVAVVLGTLLFCASAQAAKPEDIFKGKIIITAKRLPSRFASEGAFVAALRSNSTDKIWPTEEKGNDVATWNIEYIAFFARPLNDNEITVKFWEVGGGVQRYVAGDEQYTREKGSRVFASSITVGRPDFEVNKKYMMTVESGSRVLARTDFWLRGKGAQYSGKVEFSDEETRQR